LSYSDSSLHLDLA